MKRTALPDQNVRGRPLWRGAQYAALPPAATDNFDDRVSEDIFDAEDERTAVAVIFHGTIHNEQRRAT